MVNKTIDYLCDIDTVCRTGLTYIRYVVDTAREPFLILDKNLTILTANDNFYRFFYVNQAEILNKGIFDICKKQFDVPQLRKLLDNLLPQDTFLKDFEVESIFPFIGRKVLLLNARMIFDERDIQKAPSIILAIEDVTKQRLVEEKLKKYTQELESRVAERTTELERKMTGETKGLDERVKELEKLNEYMVGREAKMVELKSQIRMLEDRLGEALKEKS